MAMSENEQEKRETLADIVAEIRAYGAQPPPRLMWLEIADRIEAAWKREKSEAEADALAVGGIVEAARHKPGNATDHAMTLDEAIEHAEKVADRCDTSCGREHRQLAEWLKELRDIRRHGIGNAAAMREALASLRNAARNFCHQILNSKYNDIMDEYKCRERGFPALLDLRYAIPKANFALSGPARNCDFYDNKTDAETRFVEETGENDTSQHYWQMFAIWLFAPAAERKGEGDGR